MFCVKITKTQNRPLSYPEKAPNSEEYAKDNLPTYYQLYHNSRYAIYDYDSLNRLTQRKFTLDTPLYYNYVYKKSDNRNTEGSQKYQTTQISKEFIGSDVYIYGYDVLGNITSIKTATRSGAATSTSHSTAADYVTYSYDDLGQLTRENLAGKKTSVWDYDNLGNITAKNEYAYTTGTVGTATKTVSYYYKEDDIPYEEEPETTKTYSSWNNLLLAVDLDGSKKITVDETIEYDEIGNPTTYLGAELKWNGRQLTSYTTSDKEISYTYDSNGLRASKTVNGVVSKYFYVNGQLHYEERSDGTKLHFYYDSNGYLTGIKYNGSNYYVATNKRGDVVALYYPGGKIMGRYEYDAWGNVIKITDYSYDAEGKLTTTDLTNNPNSRDLLVVNPIRYRSYYYDVETELYYLQSRYYNAEVGRFLNADSLLDQRNLLGYNMFNYCSNNPVNKCDPTGHLPEWLNTIVDKALDVIIDIGKKSPFSSVRAAAYAADYVKIMDSARKGGMSAENKVEEAKRIQQTYTNDIFKVHNNEELTETADPICFPDLEEYKQLCESGYDKVQRVFPEDSFSDYTTSDIAVAIGSWDEETTTYIGRVTGLRVVVEDVLLNMMP